jgi:hypothetical protein
MKGIKKTVTSIFMVPTLKIPKEPLLGNGFINAYIADDRRDEQYEGCVYLLFHPKDIDKFREFLDSEYNRTKTVIDDYDYEDGYVVVVYKLNPKFKKDFELIQQGQYSRTSKEFQNQFPKTVKIKKNGWMQEEPSLQIRVFEKAVDLIEYWEEKLYIDFDESMELWEGFHPENEIMSLDFIKTVGTDVKLLTNTKTE